MKRVLTAIVLIPLVLLVLFKAPMWLFTLVVGLVAMGAAWEYLGLIGAYGLRPLKVLVLGFIAIAYAAIASDLWLQYHGFFSIFSLVGAFVFPLIALLWAMRSTELKDALPRAALSSFAIPYVFLTLLGLVQIRLSDSGIFLIIFLFVVVWSGDIFAYYAGRAFGKHKLAPRISPGKTWEGTIASFVGSVFLAHILFVDHQQVMDTLYRWHLVSGPSSLPINDKHIRLVHGVVLGGLVNIAAQLGDLVESMIKRGAGVKDSGSLLPGHGGVLDRIDALLFASPVVAFYTIILR